MALQCQRETLTISSPCQREDHVWTRITSWRYVGDAITARRMERECMMAGPNEQWIAIVIMNRQVMKRDREEEASRESGTGS